MFDIFRFPFVILAGLSLSALAGAGEAPVDYSKQIKPILTAHCTHCHGTAKQKAGLRLDYAGGIREGGNTGPAIIPGDSSKSLLAKAVAGEKGVPKMPPDEESLSAEELSLLRRWIDEGATAPKDEVVAAASIPGSKHWSYQPIRKPAEPPVERADWVRNSIDRFVLAKLEANRIAPSKEADRTTLVRRLSLDLLGLPPTITEVEEFVKDVRPDAYERLVERLLASPHYGERWGRHWLDQARYADSNGYSIDGPREIWKYRDWVIDALNKDIPFDRFTIEQLAGDLLPNATLEQKTATGFHRNTQINQEGGINVEQFRIESIVDRANTTASVWLGLTLGCCQCHDHKFDPISQREYYRFFAFFNNADEPALDIASPQQFALQNSRKKRLKDLEGQLAKLDPTSPASVAMWEKSLTTERKALLPKAVQKLLEVPDNGRSPRQADQLEAFYRTNDRQRNVAAAIASGDGFAAVVNAQMLATRLRLEKEIAAAKKNQTAAVTTMVVKERTPAQFRATSVLLGGDFTRPGVNVLPGTPRVLPPLKSGATANRLDLARWIVAPENPLMARVIVNRVWGQYFGSGLVETESDFGTQGDKPTHPELLDWLASEFRDKNWSLKTLHRTIVSSATYRQSSNARPDLQTVDARNKLLARQARLRLEAEAVRDVCLAAGGLLNPKIGGPSVFPPQPEGLYKFTQVEKNWKPNADADRFRRGMYTYFWRSAPHPALMVFDAPDAGTSCTRRNRSNTPLQALTLLNDAGFQEYARGLARRILKEAADDDTQGITRAFQICMGREPDERERDRLLKFLSKQRDNFAHHPDETKSLVDGAGKNPAREAAWVLLARVLLNLDETITRE